MTWLALMLNLFCAGLLYLVHPNQNWLPQALPARLRHPAVCFWLASLLPWCHAFGLSAGPAAWLTTSMLVWATAPYLGWLRHARLARASRLAPLRR